MQRTVSTIGSTTTVNDTITFGGYTQTSITNSTTTTTTKYYSVAGHTVAMTGGSHWYTLVGDGLGSTTLALKSDGTVQAVQLYTPFGSVRSTDGTMPTPRNYTGQLLDDATGLLYYNARYYDPAAGTFLSTDGKVGNEQGANPYGYVGGNPETLTDPTGQLIYNPGSGQVAIPQSNGSYLITGYTVGDNGSFDSSVSYTTPPPPPPNPEIRTSTGGNGSGGSSVSAPKKPTLDQINNARNVATSAATFFGGLATAAGALAFGLSRLSTLLIEWGGALLLGPQGLVTGALGVILLTLGAAAAVLAWQASRMAVVLGSLVVMYGVVENRMPDSWWFPETVQGFGGAAHAAVTLANYVIDVAAFFSLLPGKYSSTFAPIFIGQTGPLVAGRLLGTSLGLLSEPAIGHQIDYYTGLETACLTQSSCATG